jgi:Mce-associated membrane protein
VTEPDPGQVNPARLRLNTALYVLAVLAACGVLVLGVLSWREHDDRTDASTSQSGQPARDQDGNDLHAAVLEAATEEVLAFTNIDYRSAQESIDKVKAGATGGFAEQYEQGAKSLPRVLARSKSISTAEILSAGVVAADQDNATVLVATRGTVINTATEGKKAERNLRLQLDLKYVDGKWLTSDLQFVG